MSLCDIRLVYSLDIKFKKRDINKEIMENKTLGMGLAGMLIGFGVTSVITMVIGNCTGKIISNSPNDVKQGYVIPRNLEIYTQDIDRDRVDETIIRYNGTNYLFKPNEKGIPTGYPYEVTPKKIIEK